MDAVTFWSAFGILGTACGSGYLLLHSQISKNRLRIDAEALLLADRPTWKEVNDQFTRKDVLELKIEIIQKDIESVLKKLDSMSQ